MAGLLNSAKTWISGAPNADLACWVWAKDDEGDIRGFLVERGATELETPKIKGKFSLRASVTGMIMMQDMLAGQRHAAQRQRAARPVFLPQQCALRHRLGRTRCRRILFRGGARPARWTARCSAGPWRRQLVQKKLADMQTEIALGLQAVLRLSRLMDAGEAAPEMISLCKRNSCGKALEIARAARDQYTAAMASSTSIT